MAPSFESPAHFSCPRSVLSFIQHSQQAPSDAVAAGRSNRSPSYPISFREEQLLPAVERSPHRQV